MRPHPTLLALSLIVALPACTAPHDGRSGATPANEPASAGELGEIVQDLGDHLWIVFQDKKNAYWFGGDDEGVYRYDGQTLRRFTTRDGLCSDHIRQILEDESGNLYFNTCGGISKFDGRTFSTLTPTRNDTPSDGWKLQPGDL